MKAVINGVEREIQIVPVPKGGFCISEGDCFPWFPLFCAFCEAMTEEEKYYGNVLICPICDDLGIGNIVVEQIKNEVSYEDIYMCLKSYMETFESEICKALDTIIGEFAKHGYEIESWEVERAKEMYEENISKIK